MNDEVEIWLGAHRFFAKGTMTLDMIEALESGKTVAFLRAALGEVEYSKLKAFNPYIWELELLVADYAAKLAGTGSGPASG